MSIVYILTNEAMPGYIKIGMTEKDVSARMLDLDNTAVPLPFQCYYAARVSDHRKVEQALHVAFGDSRVRRSREFFALDPYRVKAVLELLAEEDVTPREEVLADKEDSHALERALSRGRRFSFASAGVPIGAELTFSRGTGITCKVLSDSTVEYIGKEMSTSKAALYAAHTCGYKWTAASGPENWLYEGETLISLRAQREMESDET